MSTPTKRVPSNYLTHLIAIREQAHKTMAEADVLQKMVNQAFLDAKELNDGWMQKLTGIAIDEVFKVTDALARLGGK
jgi:hypothetical protein